MYRLLGAKIGYGVFIDGFQGYDVFITDHELVTIGDGSVLNHLTALYAHSFENQALAYTSVSVGNYGELGVHSLCQGGAQVGDGGALYAGSKVFASQPIPSQETWAGSPAERYDASSSNPSNTSESEDVPTDQQTAAQEEVQEAHEDLQTDPNPLNLYISESDGKVLPSPRSAETKERPREPPREPPGVPGVYRWVVDIASWGVEQHGKEWGFLLALINDETERKQVSSYLKFDDQKRSLVARLLMRRACSLVAGGHHKEVQIGRTKGRKPFLSAPRVETTGFDNFNFNVSHEGKYVALASETACLCGVDVAAPFEDRKRRASARMKGVLEMMMSPDKGVLSDGELWEIRAQPTEQQQEAVLRQLWSVKEAYTKALGIGLEKELKTWEFTLQPKEDGRSSAVLTNDASRKWRFDVQATEDGHYISTARGPPTDMVDAFGKFRRTMRKMEFSAAEWSAAVDADWPAFEFVEILELVPNQLQAEYSALRAT